jgi:hypothetical protein
MTRLEPKDEMTNREDQRALAAKIRNTKKNRKQRRQENENTSVITGKKDQDSNRTSTGDNPPHDSVVLHFPHS